MLDYLEIRKSRSGGESIRSISRRLGHCQKTISRVILSATGEPLPYTRSKAIGYPKLGAFVEIIRQIIADDESAPRKQRHHAKRIYERLKSEHGYTGSYYPVRRYYASLVQSNRETFMRLDHEPGRRMEFDFGQVQVDYPEGRRTTNVLIGIWTYSNHPFLIALPSQRSESILEGMKSAFEFFGCVPKEVWWDNPKAVAVEILRGRDRTLNPTYAALASHYRFDPLFCMPVLLVPARLSDVERTVFALERRACTPVPKAIDLADFNRQLLCFSRAEQNRIVDQQTQTIAAHFELDKKNALPLPAMLSEYAKLSREAAEKDESYESYLVKLTELEVNCRFANAIMARIKGAGFPILKDLETFDFTLTPQISKQKVLELARCEWIEQKSNLCCIGNSGTGKTHLAVALGQAAVSPG